MLTDEYASALISAIGYIADAQKENIMRAAEMVGGAIARDGLVYVFGCGHSHILAEETFYRAGGLACVSPMFYEPLMLHESAEESSRLEKSEGLAEKVLAGYDISANDVLICASTSGVNAVPVELANEAKSLGIGVIGISSAAYRTQTAKNALGRHLEQVCDVCIDNAAPHGDACLAPEGLPVRMTPVSTVTGAFIINSVIAEGVQLALKNGCEPPVYMSGNVPGGAQYNEKLIERFSPRIKYL